METATQPLLCVAATSFQRTETETETTTARQNQSTKDLLTRCIIKTNLVQSELIQAHVAPLIR